MTLSKSARATMGRIGRACPLSDRGRPWFHVEKGRFYYADGREIKGMGVTELIESGVFSPVDGGLFGDTPQVYRFDPARASA